ncbi:MAG: ABC transporter ATP-binding protein [Rhodospirillaceae bacterium]|nr:ABC transporter ATP-binding protein [Rhodospirillaceae bacterium]MAX60930.1 ABC transporter ATP-binding protein [Rhodospirillaceae bacterium]MAX65252.1 ABC transporter ATP-binding protein [Rhodospirillaceae bacterium]MBB55667.1 ABC transporter ATP-binding protein [Rhodospirillaceae bacterium]|tara:strand:+ start:194 stop:940 length:747 start_codon:yes stop_codon:yes gene_type:complete
MTVLLEVRGLYKTFGGVTATKNVSLDVIEGEVHAIIGPNGAGKTTLISQLCGEQFPDAGKVRFNGRDITKASGPARAKMGIARSFQITTVFQDMTLLENVALAAQAHDGHSYRFWRDANSEPEINRQAMERLKEVGLDAKAMVLSREVSHGEHRQLEIAMALATAPKMLLLDEPMAGMGSEESQRMIEILQRFRGQKTMLLVEHDMDAVFALADRISVLVYGEIIATDTPDAIRDNEAVKRAYLGEEA